MRTFNDNLWPRVYRSVDGRTFRGRVTLGPSWNPGRGLFRDPARASSVGRRHSSGAAVTVAAALARRTTIVRRRRRNSRSDRRPLPRAPVRRPRPSGRLPPPTCCRPWAGLDGGRTPSSPGLESRTWRASSGNGSVGEHETVVERKTFDFDLIVTNQ